MIQREPVDFLDPELRGNLAAIGIRKGQPFKPDARMTALLTEGVPLPQVVPQGRIGYPRNAKKQGPILVYTSLYIQAMQITIIMRMKSMRRSTWEDNVARPLVHLTKVVLGNATARALSFAPRHPETRLYGEESHLPLSSCLAMLFLLVRWVQLCGEI